MIGTIPPRTIYKFYVCTKCETKQVCRKEPLGCVNCNSGAAWLKRIED